MTKNKKLIRFEKKHPRPDQIGITQLYRFTKFDDLHPEYLEDLLVNLKLYHSLPEKFNDPFECKPHWNWPKTANKVKAVRKRLARVAKDRGKKRKDADQFAAIAMRDKDKLQDAIRRSAIKNYQKLRICSYSSSIDNILLWSHYADSHKGICIEFDSTKLPTSISMKVHYQDEYPKIEYPLPSDVTGFIPVLTKSTAWKYEQEFRSILVAEAENQPLNDGTSFLLSRNTITNIYLGAEITDSHKEYILELIGRSNINPQIWVATLSNNTYSIDFQKLNSIKGDAAL